MKKVVIADAHSTHHPKQKIELELEGGSPYFSYIWIDDINYVIRIKGRGYTIEMVRLPKG